MKASLSDDIGRLLNQHIPLIALESSQENHAIELIQRACRDNRQTLHRWSLTDGLQTLGFGPRIDQAALLQDPGKMLQAIKERNEGGVFILCDLHPHWQSEPENIRLLKDIALNFDNIAKHIVLLSHRLDIPAELKSYVANASLTLPNDDEILSIIRQQAQRYVAKNDQLKIKTNNQALKQLIKNLRGLTHRDVARLAYHAIADDGAIDHSDVPQINSAKFSLLNQQGMLSYQFDTGNLSGVGGLDNLKSWLKQREKSFLGETKLSPPRGALLLGVQGGGKSLAAKAIAGLWNLPLLKLDMGSLYNKFIGETEKNLRESLRQAELMSPCVLWLDEIEKAISAKDQDDGVSKRLLGYFLTWMSEHTSRVFLVATSNDITQLPAELVRKGRFDEIFFVDLPNAKVRQEILSIHLGKRDIEFVGMDLNRVAAAAEGFSGAEIEQAIIAALYACEDNNTQTINEDDLINAIYKTTPLSIVMAEQINALRQWADGRTVKA